MITTVSELLEALPGATFHGTDPARVRIRAFSTDSRSIREGEAFLALSGENFDGHAFLDAAAKRGASLAIVARKWLESGRGHSLPLVVVEDPLRAYGRIATHHRRGFPYLVLAVAGSNGKTTTKELVSSVLSARYSVLRTEGNLNNLIGVPATMLRMTGDHTAAVIEIGTNAPGEIERLSAILEPTHGVITNVGREHLELLRDLEGVAEEEGALFRFLDGNGAAAFVNLSDPYIERIATPLRRRVTYGQRPDADVEGRIAELDSAGVTRLEIIDHRRAGSSQLGVQLKAPGLHTAMNALAAATIGLSLGVSRDDIQKALEAYEPDSGHGYARLAVVKTPAGTRVINDTYNANPDSMLAGLSTLAAMRPATGGRRIAVLGEMRELGESSKREHREIGRTIATMTGLSLAFFHGKEMKHAHDALVAENGEGIESRFFDEKRELIETLSKSLRPSDIVLVKGSRGMKMEEVVAALMRVQGSEF